MSFFKRLFGGGKAESDTSASQAPVQELDYKGFRIAATPYKENGEYQTCGIVSKEIDGTLMEHRFIRADRFPSIDQAAETSIMKGQQMIDQMGDQLFN